MRVRWSVHMSWISCATCKVADSFFASIIFCVADIDLEWAVSNISTTILFAVAVLGWGPPQHLSQNLERGHGAGVGSLKPCCMSIFCFACEYGFLAGMDCLVTVIGVLFSLST